MGPREGMEMQEGRQKEGPGAHKEIKGTQEGEAGEGERKQGQILVEARVCERKAGPK